MHWLLRLQAKRVQFFCTGWGSFWCIFVGLVLIAGPVLPPSGGAPPVMMTVEGPGPYIDVRFGNLGTDKKTPGPTNTNDETHLKK